MTMQSVQIMAQTSPPIEFMLHQILEGSMVDKDAKPIPI